MRLCRLRASHHPWHRNGLKFFTKDGGLDAPDIEEILTAAQEERARPTPKAAAVFPAII